MIIVSMIRRMIFWAHLCIGVAAGIAIFIMSITGVLLAFERQILQFADRDLRTVNGPAGTRQRDLGEMLATVSASTRSAPSSVLIRSESSASVEFTFGRDRSVYVDPYTGAVLGEGSKTARAFFAAVERWHRTLGEPLGSHGPLRAVAASTNLLFFVLVVSGFYLWLPRKWSWAVVRAALLFRPGLCGRARDWNWHNVAGLWCALPLVLITFTGVIISYPWANALLFRLAGSAPPARQESGRPQARPGSDRERSVRQGTSADLDRAVLVVSTRLMAWHSMSLRVPGSGDSTVPVTLDSGTGGEVEKRILLLVDTRTGQVLRETRFADNSLGQRLRALVRFIHTGEEAGLAGQFIAAVASAGAGLLVWTGVSLALRRLRAARS